LSLATVAQKIETLSGWRRYVAAYVFGFAAATALPPFNLVPILWVCFPALLFLLRGTSGVRAAFATGWTFSFGYLTLSLYWIAGALFVDIKSFWWALPFAVAGLPAVLSLYYGLAAMAARKWGLGRPDGLFFFALCWFLADMARGHLFTGFPWDILGYAWGDVLPILQSTSVFGIDGLTLLTLCLAVLPAAYVVCATKRTAHVLMGSGVLLLVGMFLAGQVRLDQASHEMVEGVRLRLVQPHTSQSMKWRPEQRLANFQKLMTLSFDQSADKPITHTIWPETAVAYYLTEEPNIRARIAEVMPKDSVLLTGVVRRQVETQGEDRYYNSLIAMDSSGTVVAGYDKFHLVPFGEYMPGRSFIPFQVISTLGVDFTAGEGPRTLRVPHLPPFSGLVCYEGIFSGDVIEAEAPPSFLLNVTNDAWYDGTIGLAQHFAIVRVRAIEQGIPLVRVANNGITGVVDSYGRVVASFGANEAGFVDSDLPAPIKKQAFMGLSFAPISFVFPWFLALCLVVIRLIRRKRRHSP